MWLKIGKFEWKIVIALLITAAAPLVFNVFFVDRLVKESMSIGLNERVLSGLRSGVDLFKEVIESRIRLLRLQGYALVHENKFLQSVKRGDFSTIQQYLEKLIAANTSIEQVRLLAAESLVIEEKNPLVFPQHEWKKKTESWDMPDGHRLEVTLAISKKFLNASAKLRDLVVTLENVQDNFQPWQIAYYKLFLFIYTWILVAAVVLGLFLSRSVTKRLARLVLATEGVARGDWNVRVKVGSADEIGSLAFSFNLMMDEIQRGRDQISYLEKISSWQEIARRLAHEIKNPLTPIQLSVQELHRSYNGSDPIFLSKLNTSAEIVEEEVGTLRRLVETFSEFAKMPPVIAEEVKLNTFVAEFLKYNPQFDERVTFCPSSESINVKLDRDLMRMVLQNLVTNGLEAAQSQGTVHIEMCREDNWGVIRVIDRGPGIPEEIREKIFQPYFTTKSDGTGLGLAIVKKIVVQHKGEIYVKDGEVSGSVFTIRLQVESPNKAEELP